MKIGIFGDSFAATTTRNHKIYEGHPILDEIGKPWPVLLKETYTDVDIFAQAGSDLYFSYKLFKDNFQSYDKNIFIVTSAGRRSVSLEGKNYLHFSNSLLAEHINDRTEGIEKDISAAAINWFRYLLDYEREDLFHDLMVKEIKKIDPNCLIIHSFDNKHSLGLINIFKMENHCWNADIKNGDRKHKDFRYCHMTKENNQIMHDKINYCIRTSSEFNLNLTEFRKPKIEEYKKYILTIHEAEQWRRKK